MKITVLLAAGLCLAAPLHAQEDPRTPAPERVHVVRTGDTLWDIARRYLNDPFLWPEVFRLNPRIVQDPALIYPAERLRIPGGGRAPRVADIRGGEPERTVFFPRDADPRQQMGPIIRAAGTADVPILAPGDFYRAGLLVPDSEIPSVGRLVDVLSPTVVPLDLYPQIALYDKVFVTVSGPGAVRIGDRLHFFREGRRVKPYGSVFYSTGLATVAAIDGNTVTAVIVRMYDNINVGDVAVRAAPFPVPAGVLPQPATGLDGEIIAFQTPHPLQADHDIVFVDLGMESGVAAGDEFIAYLPPEPRRGWTRPEVEVARLQVVRVTGRTAAARVAGLRYPALEAGMPIRLVGKMP